MSKHLNKGKLNYDQINEKDFDEESVYYLEHVQKNNMRDFQFGKQEDFQDGEYQEYFDDKSRYSNRFQEDGGYENQKFDDQGYYEQDEQDLGTERNGQNRSIEFVEDGYYNKKDRYIPMGSRHGQDYISSSEDWNENIEYYGRKNTNDTRNIGSIKKKFGYGFNWKKVSRVLTISLIIFAVLGLIGGAGVVAWASYQYSQAEDITDPSKSSLFNINESSVVYARDGKTKIFEFFGDGGKREVVPIDHIPENMQMAVIALEDRFFYTNEDGIPWRNMLGAAVECFTKAADNCRGASGLSQQLVKNATGDDEVTFNRKIRELFTAIKLNEGLTPEGKPITKDVILQQYLNIIFFGRNSYGVQQASKSFYGHNIDAKDENGNYKLTVPKACFLAALVQNPTRYTNSIKDRESGDWKVFETRKNECIDILAGVKYREHIKGDKPYISIKDPEALKALKSEEVNFVEVRQDDPYPHFREYIDMELDRFLITNNINPRIKNTKGLKIITTLDPEIQKMTEQAFADNASRIRDNGGDNAAGLVMDGKTGEILAMVGSLDYNNQEIKGKVNVTLRPRQPGSSVKPYVYASAFDKNFNPGTVLMDSPTTFENNYKPKNYSNTFRGPTTIQYALSNSLNIPAVKALYLSAGIGRLDGALALKNWFDFTEKAGLRFPCQENAGEKCNDTPETGEDAVYRKRCGISASIGGCEVTAISHATGINTLLQEGNLRTATPFISIKDKDGNELFKDQEKNKLYPSQDAAINPKIARQIANVMAVQDRPEFGSFQPQFTIPGWKLAGKTGTTDFNDNTWMVGGSQYFTTVVWAGRTDNKPMKAGAVASNLALPIWNQIQKGIHKNKDPKNFSTEGLKLVALDPSTGFIAEGGIPELLTDEQISVLRDAGARVAIPEYNPRSKNIFENRSAVLVRKFKFNKLDDKLATDKTLESNIKEKVCTDYIGEFPDIVGWSEAFKEWIGASITFKGEKESDDKVVNSCGIFEKSDQDQVSDKDKKPVISANIRNGQVLGDLEVKADIDSEFKKIKKVTVKVNGQVAETVETNEKTVILRILSQDINKYTNPINNVVVIEVEDTSGQTNSQTYDNLNVGSSNSFRYSSSSNSSRNNNNSSGVSANIQAEIQSPGVIRSGSSARLQFKTDIPVSGGVVIKLEQPGITRSCNARDEGNNTYSCSVDTTGFDPGSAKIILDGNNNISYIILDADVI